MSFKKLWIYLAVLLFVAGTMGCRRVLFSLKNRKGKKSASLLPTFHADKIQEIQWQRGAEVVHLKKNKGWEIIQPLSDPADSTVVNNILRTLSSLTPEKRFSVSGQDLKEFGLDSPRVKLLFLNQGKWFEIQVGKKTPVGNDSYVRVSHFTGPFFNPRVSGQGTGSGPFGPERKEGQERSLMSKILSCLKKRDLLHNPNIGSSELAQYGWEYFKQDRPVDALDFFEKAQDLEGIRRIREWSLEQGDPFLLQQTSKLLKETGP